MGRFSLAVHLFFGLLLAKLTEILSNHSRKKADHLQNLVDSHIVLYFLLAELSENQENRESQNRFSGTTNISN